MNKVDFWLSLHDISPNVGNIKQAVYCHNPSPFNKISIKDIYLQPIQVLFKLFYKYLYKINLNKNRFIIVQQLWIKDQFHQMFGVDREKIIVAQPLLPEMSGDWIKESDVKEEIYFVFPTFPRPFKNIELLCKAVIILNSKGIEGFKVLITIAGDENNYSRIIYNRYKNVKNVKFTGLLKREGVYDLYSKSDCLIFPSKLETWGLPISEFMKFDKPIFVADAAYAKETVSNYQKAKFFDANDANQLAFYMSELIEGRIITFDKTEKISYPRPFAKNWDELFNILLG